MSKLKKPVEQNNQSATHDHPSLGWWSSFLANSPFKKFAFNKASHAALEKLRMDPSSRSVNLVWSLSKSEVISAFGCLDKVVGNPAVSNFEELAQSQFALDISNFMKKNLMNAFLASESIDLVLPGRGKKRFSIGASRASSDCLLISLQEKPDKSDSHDPEELAVLRVRQQLALNSIDAGLWDWDVVNGQLFFSDKWKSMLGYNNDEVPPSYSSWANLVHPEDLPGVESMLNDYLAGKISEYRSEIRMRTKSGDYRWILTTGVAQRDSDGKPLRITGWHHDVHEQKQKALVLKASASNREEILASIQDGFISITPNFVITYANEAACELTNIERDKMVGVNMKELFTDESAGEFFRQYERALKAKIQVEFEAKYVETYFHVVAYPSSSGLSILFRNVTEQIVLRQDVEEQKIALLNASRLASLGEMAGGIAHEINNPLAVIVGKAQTLRMLLSRPEFDQEKAGKAIDTIEDTGNRIAKIIKGLRSFARDEEQDPFTRVSFASIIEDTLSFSQARFHSHGVNLKVGELPPAFEMIECRPAQLGQVFLNLLNNALEAVADLPDRWVSLEVYVTNSRFVMKVVDSGPGIPEAIREKMMNPFFTTKQVGKGTGLGLSISKGIVISHGGDLYYDPSAPNTCFVVELPKEQLFQNGGKKGGFSAA